MSPAVGVESRCLRAGLRDKAAAGDGQVGDAVEDDAEKASTARTGGWPGWAASACSYWAPWMVL